MSSLPGHRTKWHKTVTCGCKINLRLKVTGRRADGLHDLSSCFVYLPYPGDILSVAGGEDGIRLEVPGYPELANEKNLVWKAAERYAASAGISPQWSIVLEKKVPLAAGLGGGSADAAGVLRLLNRHYEAFDENILADMALTLGADCPFFLYRKPVWAEGVGEKLSRIEKKLLLPEILIVYPGFPTSAKWAYTHLSEKLISPDDPDIKERFERAFENIDSANWENLCRNDLAPAVFNKFPLLELLKQKLLLSGAFAVQLSGSGSSLFALFAHGKAAAAAEALAEEYRDFYGMRIFTGGKEF